MSVERTPKTRVVAEMPSLKPPKAPLRAIRPKMGDKAPRWVEIGGETKCGCDFCQHWSPLIDHISAQLDENGKALLNELVEDWMYEGEDRAIAEAKLDGEWPGWEEMKNFKPKD